MKEFVISDAQTEKAALVGLITQTQNERKTNEYLDELAFLAETAGAEVVKRFTQKMDYPNTVTYVGKGKLQEIKEYLLQKKEEEGEGNNLGHLWVAILSLLLWKKVLMSMMKMILDVRKNGCWRKA